MSLAGAALAGRGLAGRGLAVRGRHRAEALSAGCGSPPEPVPLHPADPGDCGAVGATRDLDYDVPTEAEIYAEFITSLNLRYITAAEVIRPHWSDIRGVRNELPPEELWPLLPATLRIADEMRHRLGVPLLKITSAYRSPEYNRMVAGSANQSYHLRNQALDLVFACSASRATAMARQLRKEGLFKGGIGQYSTFVHLDTRGYNANWRKG